MFFFFNDTATTEIYTLSLHDALPISAFSKGAKFRCGGTASVEGGTKGCLGSLVAMKTPSWISLLRSRMSSRSEEHTSELQSRSDLVCRLLLEKKKKMTYRTI